ncbi:MAG: hypothetical protein Tsb004_12790 [Allomuricauda sp.]
MKINPLVFWVFLVPMIGLSQYEVKVGIENNAYVIAPPHTIDEAIQKADPSYRQSLFISQAVEMKRYEVLNLKDVNEKIIYYGILKDGDTLKLQRKADKDLTEPNSFRLKVESDTKSKVVFSIQRMIAEDFEDTGERKTFYYCDNSEMFVEDMASCTKSNTDYEEITQIPMPRFTTHYDELPKSRTHRYLVIDANPNPLKKANVTLYKRKSTDSSYQDTIPFMKNFFNLMEGVKSIPRNSSVSIFMAYHSFRTVKDLTIKINGTDYVFEKGVEDIYKGVTQPETMDTKEATNSKDWDDNANGGYLAAVEAYLYSTEHPISFLNINDLKALESYKQTLQNVIRENNIKLSNDDILKLSRILNWYPQWISVTPIAKLIPDTDEVTFETELTYENVIKSKGAVGNYRVSGGMSFNLGSRLYMTGLKNNTVYTEDIETTDGATEKRAQIDADNQTSVGIGLNGEIAFRTGSMVDPTFNLGFFVPFEENISPYFAIGPGLTLTTSKVKFSCSGGLAIGSVNAVAERYVDKDVSDVTDITSLAQKVWDSSWYLSVGISYELK